MRTDIEYVRSLESRMEELRTAADLADVEYREEIASLRLTDAEREAIANGASSLEAEVMREGLSLNATAYMRKHAATLRGLLARLS